jgi:hypothetical protein
MRKYPVEVPATTTRISSNTSHSTAVICSEAIGERSGRILMRGSSRSDQPRTRIRDLLARARAWVSSAQRRLGSSTSHPSFPAPTWLSSSHAMHPSSVAWLRLHIIFFSFFLSFCFFLLQIKRHRTFSKFPDICHRERRRKYSPRHKESKGLTAAFSLLFF